MNIIYLLAPLAILLGTTFAILFILATRSGQYDDTETPSRQILFDDDAISPDEQLKGTAK